MVGKTPYPLQWTGGLISMVLPYFVKFNSSRIVLTSFHGDGYRGNTKVLFEALCSHSRFEPVWLSRNTKIVRDLKQRFGDNRAMHAHHPAGLHALASAGAVLFTHGTSDFPFLYLPRRAKRIQTYHGLPTKRGEYLRPEGNRHPNWLHRRILAYRFGPVSFFLSSSPLVTDIFAARFNLPKSSFLETGYPSYDELTTDSPSGKDFRSIWPDAPEADKIILYAPTFRQFNRTRWFPFDDLDPGSLTQFLEERKALLILRAHPNEKHSTSGYEKMSPRILKAGHDVIENVNRLLSLSDVIVTDYSSIYLEGLLKDIPPVFIPYDLDTYERGFPVPYKEVTPGPHVGSQVRFLEAIDRALYRPEDYRPERERVRNLFFSLPDGNATKRLIQFLETS